MSDLLQEMFARGPLIGAGGGFIFIGLLCWGFPRFYRGMVTVRRDYAAKLRAIGKIDKAASVENETDIILRRVPRLGQLLTAIGISAILAAIFIAK